MASYIEWNDALAARFFRADTAGKLVYLQITDDVVREVATELGATADEFAEVVLRGPQWATRDGLCQRALQAMYGWRARRLASPPYIAYLAVFVLAAGLDGDYAVHAYYPRLHDLLGTPREHMPPSFDRMDELWQDLETWSTQDRHGELGVFTARSVGGFIHVGYPLAQAILTAHEREVLPGIFAESGLDPSWPPPRGELARQVRTGGRGLLRGRTLQVLGGPTGEARDVVLDAVLEELLEWDGRSSTVGADGQPDTRVPAGLIRLCLAFDPIALTARARARCRLAEQFPEEQLTLRSVGLPELWCVGDIGGWSTPLRLLESDVEFDSTSIDWTRGAQLREPHRGWHFRLPPARVRLFVEGSPEGLPGLIEVPRVPVSGWVLVVVPESEWASLSEWAANARSCAILGPVAGLPGGLVAATLVDPATPSEALENAFPFMESSKPLRLKYRGGLRAGAGNTFFAFAAPSMTVEALDPADTVSCSGIPLETTSDPSVMELPAELPTETQMWVEVTRNGQPVSQQSLFLVSEFDWRRARAISGEDDLRRPTAVATGGTDASAPDGEGRESFRRSAVTAPGFHPLTRYHLVGARPGQVQAWPDRGLPTEWSPVWAVPRRKHQQVVYCGTDVRSEEPSSEPPPGATRRDLGDWREVLWGRRKQVRPPRNPLLARLWSSYQETARDARIR